MKFRSFATLAVIATIALEAAGDTFRLATYNLQNYLDTPTETRRYIKSSEAKAKIRESIRAINPDVLALQEVGATNALMELVSSLKNEGQVFPFWEFVQGADTNIHVAVLSKLPISASHPRTNDEFLLDGKRFRVSRGFADVEIHVATNFTFTLIAVHLKSPLNDSAADPTEQRLEEAKILRNVIDEHLRANPDANLVVLGDFNDSWNSDALKTVVGRGKHKLTDIRPAERNGDDLTTASTRTHPPRVAWTYYFNKDDTYSRIDYILLSPAMTRHWVSNETYALSIANWGIGSDHRPIVAAFEK